MTKKLVVLSLALAAAVAASLPRPANALSCGQGSHIMVCGDISFCCPKGVNCWC